MGFQKWRRNCADNAALKESQDTVKKVLENTDVPKEARVFSAKIIQQCEEVKP